MEIDIFAPKHKTPKWFDISHDKWYGETSDVGIKQLHVKTRTSLDITNNRENTETHVTWQ